MPAFLQTIPADVIYLALLVAILLLPRILERTTVPSRSGRCSLGSSPAFRFPASRTIR